MPTMIWRDRNSFSRVASSDVLWSASISVRLAKRLIVSKLENVSTTTPSRADLAAMKASIARTIRGTIKIITVA